MNSSGLRPSVRHPTPNVTSLTRGSNPGKQLNETGVCATIRRHSVLAEREVSMPATRKSRRDGQGRVRTRPKKLSAKSGLVRETGLAPLPQMPWGTHLCMFYKTKDDLLDTCVSWFEAGVAGKECCVWVISDLVSEVEVLQVLRQRIPNFEALRQSGLFKIFWMARTSTFWTGRSTLKVFSANGRNGLIGV